LLWSQALELMQQGDVAGAGRALMALELLRPHDAMLLSAKAALALQGGARGRQSGRWVKSCD